MKKILKIFVIFFILAGILIIDLPQILSLFSLDTKLKDYIVKTINDNNEKVLSIDNIHIDFWKIELSDIKLNSSTASTQFVLKNAKFNYNIWKLLTESSSPQNAITEVVFVEPKLIIKHLDFETNLTKNKFPEVDSLNYNFLDNFTQFKGIDKILLQDARIIYRKESGEFIVLANNLNGWLNRENSAKITVNTKGSILYGSDNFSLHCDLNLAEKKMNGRIELANYFIKNTKFLINQKDLSVESGVLDGRVYISANSFNIDSLNLSGHVNILDLSSEFLKSEITDFKARLILDKNQFSLSNALGKFNGSSFNLSASINDIFHPVLTGEFKSNHFKMSSLEPYINNTGFNGSIITVTNKFKITNKDTISHLTISSPEIAYNDELIENLSLNIDYLNSDATIKNINCNYLGYEVNSKGLINLKHGGYSLGFQGIRKFGAHKIFDNLSKKNQFIDIDLKGNIFKNEVEGYWKYQISAQEDTLLNIDGRINLNNELFNFAMNKSAEQDFIFSLQIANIFDKPEVNFGYIENLPFHLFTSRSWIKDLSKKFTFQGILVGPFSDLNTELKFFIRNNEAKALVLNGNIKDLLEIEKTISGNWKFNDFTGNANFKLGEEYLLGDIFSEDYITSKIDLNLQRKEQLNAFLKLNNFNINQFFTDTTFGGYGDITGDFNIKGDLDNPVVTSSFEGNKFVLNDVGYYKFTTHLQATKDILDFDSLSISLNNLPILTGDVKIDLESKSIMANAKGNNIDADYIFKTIFGENNIITGEAEYDFKVSGSYSAPAIFAKIKLKNGQFDQIHFNDLHIELSDSIPEKAKYLDYKNHLINIKKFRLVNNGQFHFEGNGTFPLYSNGEIDIDLDFNGDILSLIPNWSDFFIDGASFSTISLKVAGTPDKPKILEGFVEIERGELWLADVAEHIDELSGKIIVTPGSKKVDFQDLIASIDGNELKINTVHNIRLSNDKYLEPWYFKDFDLDFGILELETSGNGIELNIPGLMVGGENGFIALAGKTEDEKFYFAGPVRRPTARGAVTLSKSRISYPFPPKKRKEKDSTEEFLENMQWDVFAYAGRDLKFDREISAFLGKVNTELIINSASEGLEFFGVIKENTFKVNGKLYSDRGRLDYLDLNLRVENFGVEFDRFNQKPRVYGRAWTVVRDSIQAIPKTIYLELYAVDKETGQETQSASWEDFRFRLVSADPTIGETQEQVLAYLGYSVDNIRNKASEVGGAVTENYLIRPILRPIERSLERYLGFDLVRFNSSIAKNIFHLGLGQTPGLHNSKSAQLNYTKNVPYLFLFESSEVTVGKYLSRDLYLTYTGQLVATTVNQENEYNLNHSFGLEYRFFKNILLEFEYDREILNYYEDFSNKPYLEDFRIR